MATPARRAHMAKVMDYLLAHTGQVHYAQLRPMDWTTWSEAHLHYLLENGHGVWADCSESATAICKWAGLKDPNGNRYSGYGNTDSMYAHLPRYTDAKRALTGALCIFGIHRWGTQHVAMVRHPDPKHGDPTMWSHGTELDPRLFPFSVLRAYFGSYSFLSIAKL